jgi:LAO/AO transport system kinase
MTLKKTKEESVEEIIQGLRQGEFRVLSRAISLVEDGHEAAVRILDQAYRNTGKSYRIGITGPPGAGKSTIVSRIVKWFRANGQKVGIIAVDPTSPFSGGAVLGDRIRMTELVTDEGTFIRSMATRGSLGGLSKTAQEVADLMAAAGMDIIIFETVGVGQGELDVAQAADTTVVVLVPESGDSIQAMKAGLMEIADIFVINKSDRDGAEKMKIELEMMLQLRTTKDNWMPPILNSIAQNDVGIEDLHKTVLLHGEHLQNQGILEKKRFQRLYERMQEMIRIDFEKRFWDKKKIEYLHSRMDDILERRLTPQKVVLELKELDK